MNNKYIQLGLIGSLLISAFLYGNTYINPQLSSENEAIPQQLIYKQHQAAVINGLQLTIKQALRIQRPNANQDLAIITVTFTGSNLCEIDNNNCTFNRNNFQLYNPEDVLQPRTTGGKFLPGIKYVQLANSRQLNSLNEESGQLYFLIDKLTETFHLSYYEQNQTITFAVKPITYTNSDAIKNLTMTPIPTTPPEVIERLKQLNEEIEQE